jgi:transpeptidase family protein
VIPRYLHKVSDYDGAILEEKYPEVQEVVSERTARIMTSMLREVVTHGTAVAASRMKYSLAGKTETTNDFTDAWFMGFHLPSPAGVDRIRDKKSRGKGNRCEGCASHLDGVHECRLRKSRPHQVSRANSRASYPGFQPADRDGAVFFASRLSMTSSVILRLDFSLRPRRTPGPQKSRSTCQTVWDHKTKLS